MKNIIKADIIRSMKLTGIHKEISLSLSRNMEKMLKKFDFHEHIVLRTAA